MLKVSGMMIIIKTWTNSWYTSHRLHEPHRLPCIFGCEIHDGCSTNRVDSLEHYLDCRVLWKQIATNIECAEFRSGLEPVQKACLVNPSLNDMKHIIVAFKTYHAIRLSHSEMVRAAINSENFRKVHELMIAYIRANAKDLSLCLVHVHM